jgi:hypothetical protein
MQPGTHALHLVVTDREGSQTSASVQVRVQDALAPLRSDLQLVQQTVVSLQSEGGGGGGGRARSSSACGSSHPRLSHIPVRRACASSRSMTCALA